MPPTLHLRDEKSGSHWEVWPQQTLPEGAVHENGAYVFELFDCPNAGLAELYLDEVPLEALRSTDPTRARWRWQIGFQAGVVDLRIALPHALNARFELQTDPVRAKLTREHFDTMLRDILEDTFALFALSSFNQGVGRGNSQHVPPIGRLQFLRTRIQEIERVVHAIARSPRRRLQSTTQNLPYYLARRATGPEIIRSLSHGVVLREQGSTTRLPRPLRGYLPRTITTARRVDTLDLPEHRRMSACLLNWSEWLDRCADQLATQPLTGYESQTSLWRGRCLQLSRQVRRLTDQAPFQDAKGAPPYLMLTPLFRTDPKYRRFYALWRDMNLGIANVFGDFLNLPLARTFDLYELWCFLRLARAAAELSPGARIETDKLFIYSSGSLQISAGGASVDLGNGRSLLFQKSYREFWLSSEGGSYSRTMVPDVVIRDNSSAELPLIVLDAKYRIDEGLNDALSSIHMYRDALVAEQSTNEVKGIVGAAYLLTPFQPPSLAGDYKTSVLPGRLFHPEYRRSFRFGAVTLRPSMSASDVRAALQTILLDSMRGAAPN